MYVDERDTHTQADRQTDRQEGVRAISLFVVPSDRVYTLLNASLHNFLCFLYSSG